MRRPNQSSTQDTYATPSDDGGVVVPIHSSRRSGRSSAPEGVTDAVSKSETDDGAVTLPAAIQAEAEAAVLTNGLPSETPTEVLARVLAASEERVTAVQQELYAAVGGDVRSTELVLEGLLEYQRYRRTFGAAQRLYRRAQERTVATTVLEQEIGRLQESAATAVQILRTLVDNPDRLESLVAKVMATTPEKRSLLDETLTAAELAERCAILRALVAQAKQRLARLPSLSVRQRSLREQLQQFAHLDTLPYVPRSASERDACQVALQRLEPLYARLETDIATLPEPEIASPARVDLVEASVASTPTETDTAAIIEEYDQDEEVAQSETAWFEDFAAASDEAVVTLPDTDAMNEADYRQPSRTDVESAQIAEDMAADESVSDWSAAATPTASASESTAVDDEFSLGWYELQHGDSLSDIIYGESSAGWLPCVDEIDPSALKRLFRAVREYLTEYEYVRSYVGFPVGDPQWWLERGGRTTISLDRLNDVMMYVGVQYQFINLSRSGRAQLRAQFAPLEAQKTYVPASAQFTPRHVQKTHAERPLEQLFAGVATWLTNGGGTSGSQSPEETVATPTADGQPTAATSRATGDAQLRSAEERVIESAYQGNAISYQRDRQIWISRTLLPPADRATWSERIFGDTQQTDELSVILEPLTNMTVAQWQHFAERPSERYEWLIQHGVRPSGWKHIASVISRWYQLAKQSTSVKETTTVAYLARYAFLHQVAHQSNSQSGRP